MNKIICAGYIFFMTGFAWAEVGKMPEGINEPYPWWLPLIMFFILVTPAFLGYQAGKDDSQ